MKTLFTVALASALSFSSLVASASEDLKALSAVSAKHKKINVTLNEGLGKARISILDENGKHLKSTNVQVKGENLMVPFNMQSLPAGDYQVKIATEQEEVTYEVVTTDFSAPLTSAPLMAYTTTVDENTVSLLVVGLEKPGVEVEVFWKESNQLLYRDQIDEVGGFRKAYSFGKKELKDLYFKVSDAQGRTKTLYL